jgi:hypothetical protein
MRCQECGDLMEVTDRHARRVKDAPVCRQCRNTRTLEPRESDYRFWCDTFGVTVPRGRTARETLVEGPLPDELAQIVGALRP